MRTTTRATARQQHRAMWMITDCMRREQRSLEIIFCGVARFAAVDLARAILVRRNDEIGHARRAGRREGLRPSLCAKT